ncbi:uncharacterized protein EHS24_000356 [Apiotrichum porosum]|uniref:Uncharacterized protein n=1 Tax=Apiotrichum porosum TaxID=105984 RepID=A0A427Y9S1_9TREE|nr:uncharacterized protein EHS24_000356 [Apiotrichum porosum]RSH87838.1 hypothetical protein EHS24_000356 [Apiotrichum porosum]
MKRWKLASASPPPPSPWRWDIGGPITDFCEDGIEAGPSSCAAPAVDAVSSVSRPNRRRRLSPFGAFTAALALSLPLVPLASAGPVPVTRAEPGDTALSELPAPTGFSITTPTTTPIPDPAPTLDPRRLHAEPEYVAPSTLPSVPAITLPETVLPYYLSQSSDGYWYKVDRAWSLYGREAASDETGDTSASITIPIASYAVASILPTGWGNTSKRGSLYKTPLIAASAVLLAVIIVAGIIFITIQRRKTLRRQKRHDARVRRKALAAAGITEDDMRNANEETERLFRERLAEIERMHQAKRRSGKTSKSVPHGGNTTIVRTKVRVWRKGVRRRRTAQHGGNDDLKEHSSPNGGAYTSANLLRRRSSLTSSIMTRSDASLATTVSSVDSHDHSPPRDQSPRILPSTEESATGSDNHTGASDTLAQTTSASDAPLSLTSSSASSPPAASASSPTAASGGPSTAMPHMPPAYRPASVRSMQAGPSVPPGSNAAAGASSASSAALASALSPEKVAAAGFYPAPATEDAEVAQAIAHRADAKSPIIVPPEEEQERERRHIATDDKRELERLRLGASAPPVVRTDNADFGGGGGGGGDGDESGGPSAPSFHVDAGGFEVFPPEDDVDGEADAGPSHPAQSPASLRVITGIPAPPVRGKQRSLYTFSSAPSSPVGGGGGGGGGVGMTPLSPLPSAPPGHDQLSVPSAPPLHGHDDDAADRTPSAPPLPSAPPPHGHDEVVPSAPAFAPDDDGQGHDPEHHAADHGTADHDLDHDLDAVSLHHSVPGPDHPHHDADSTSLSVSGHRFLPRYEP